MNRNGIIKHIELHIAKEGSMNALAKKININVGALSTIMRGKYGADESAMLSKIATALNYRERDWNTVRTITNYQIIKGVLEDARDKSLWFAVSNKAGSGKTETLEDLYNLDETGAVVFIQAEEWSARQLLLKLVEKTVGTLPDKSYKTIAQLTDMVVNYFNLMAADRPVLIIDETDKLKAPALRALIPIFNRTEYRLGAILAGTENLQKEIDAGARYKKKGYDEIRSRVNISHSGDGYITLPGATKNEVLAICEANGISDAELRMAIWNEIDKVKRQAKVRTATGEKDATVEFCEDFRRLRRLIIREQLKLKKNG